MPAVYKRKYLTLTLSEDSRLGTLNHYFPFYEQIERTMGRPKERLKFTRTGSIIYYSWGKSCRCKVVTDRYWYEDYVYTQFTYTWTLQIGSPAELAYLMHHFPEDP